MGADTARRHADAAQWARRRLGAGSDWSHDDAAQAIAAAIALTRIRGHDVDEVLDEARRLERLELSAQEDRRQ